MNTTSLFSLPGPLPSPLHRLTGLLCGSILVCGLVACGDSDGNGDDIQEHTVPTGSESIRPEDAASPPATSPTPSDSTTTQAADDDTATPTAPAAGTPAESYAETTSGNDTPSWALPADWRLDPGERAMRHRTYVAEVGDEPVEIAISRFPGDVGGMVANVNRWRSQVGLSPIDEDAAEELIERFDQHPGYAGYTVHLQGEDTHMLVGSIFEEAHNRTWYVRAILPPEAAPRLRPTLFEFARSFGQSGE